MSFRTIAAGAGMFAASEKNRFGDEPWLERRLFLTYCTGPERLVDQPALVLDLIGQIGDGRRVEQRPDRQVHTKRILYRCNDARRNKGISADGEKIVMNTDAVHL